MSDSRLRHAPRRIESGRFDYPSLLFLVGLVCTSLFFVGKARGDGFGSYDQFEKSKKLQNLPVWVEALSTRDNVRPGDTFLLYVVAVLEKGWHLYSMENQSDDETVATRIELETTEFTPQGSWQETPPRLVHDEVMQKIMKIHSGRVEFSRQLSVPKGLKPGVYPISGTLRFRSCDNRICTLPRQVRFQTHVIVEAGRPG